jgi:hypothetical protein
VGWPTKLALAPDFADRVSSPERDGIQPGAATPLPTCRAAAGRPAWEQLLP